MLLGVEGGFLELTVDCSGGIVDGSTSKDVVVMLGSSDVTRSDSGIDVGGVETENKADEDERRDSGAAVLECASESCDGDGRGKGTAVTLNFSDTDENRR